MRGAMSQNESVGQEEIQCITEELETKVNIVAMADFEIKRLHCYHNRSCML